MSNRRIKNWLKRIRNQEGMYLVELLVALFIAGYLTAILGSNLAQLISLSSSTQQTQVASLIAQSIIERMRNTPWNSLQPGTYNIRINYGDAGDTNTYAAGSQISQSVNRALQLDDINLTYTTGNSSAPMPTYMFGSNIEANAVLVINPITQNTIPITVMVSWVKSGSGPHTYTCQAILTQNGTQVNVPL